VRTILILFILVLFTSCGKNKTEETREAIDVALTYLSSGECREAINVLEEVRGGNDPVYLQVLASAYACLASFDEIRFIDHDLSNINSTSPGSILQSISVLELSPESEADSFAYSSVRSGINIVLNSKKQTERTAEFGSRKSGDMGVQALILSIVNFGKFLNYFGNVSATGVKGGGSGTNSCFINYNDPRAQALTGISTGACTGDTDGHQELVQSTAVGKRRLCEGLMLITNIIDILNNIDLSHSSSLSVLEDVATQVNTYRTTAEAAGLGTLINMTSQKECETHLGTPAHLLDMEYLYALVFETGLQ